jgi:hypothetical protein
MRLFNYIETTNLQESKTGSNNKKKCFAIMFLLRQYRLNAH